MVNKKIGLKLKIAAIIVSALVVVSSVVAYSALATNASDSQDGLYSGGASNNGIATLSGDTGVEIVSNGISWTNDEATAPVIGAYTIDQGGQPVNITSNVLNWDAETMTVEDISGATHSGEDMMIEWKDVFDKYSTPATISLSKAGVYSATITKNDDSGAPIAQETFYAKIAKHKVQQAEGLDDAAAAPSITYAGSRSSVWGIIKNIDKNIIRENLAYHIEGYYFLDSADTERVRIADGIKEDDNAGFSVVNAGDYKVFVSIKDTNNYEWSDEIKTNLNADGYKEIGSFTVEQAPIPYMSSIRGYNQWSPNPPATKLQVEFAPNFTSENITSKLTSTPGRLSGDRPFYGRLAFYKDANYTQLIENDEFEVGTVYAQVVGFYGTNNDSTTFRNYCLPPQSDTNAWDELRCSFRITECKIDKPMVSNANFLTELNGKYSETYTGLFYEGNNEHPQVSGNSISATYQGWDYVFSQFIFNTWETEYLNGAALNITVEGLSGQNPSMRNVKVDPNDSTKYLPYIITVTPAKNYVWETGGSAAVTFTLTIAPKELTTANFTWDTTYNEYNGEKHSFDNGCTVSGLFNGDSLTATLDVPKDPIYKYYDDEGHKLEQPEIIDYSDPTNAGHYDVKVAAIDGDSKDNYILPSYVIEHRFTINRKALPQMPTEPIVTGTFNGSEQEFPLLDIMKELGLITYNGSTVIPLAVSENITCSYPAEWNAGTSLSNHGARVYLATNFTATHAGYYTIKFMINSAVQMNYCWYGEDNSPRTNENPDEYVWTNFAFIDRVEVPAIQLPSDKHYIAVGNDFVDISAAITDILGEQASIVNILGFGVVGSASTSANQQAVDCDESGKHKIGNYYALIELTNKDNLVDVAFGASVAGYFENLGNGQAKVYYSVASNVISFGYSVNGYTFGDNVSIANVITRVSFNLPQGVTAGSESYAFYTDREMENPLDASLLKNGLPRNAGTYYLKVTVQLTGSEEDSWSNDVAYELTVSKLPIEVSWTIDGNAASATSVYNGQTRVIAATNTKTVAGVSNVGLTLGGVTDVKNADSYVFTVTGITGAEADNFTLEGAKNYTFNYEITPIQITVTATELSKTIGVDKVSESELVYTLTGAFLAGEESNLSVWLYKNGVRYTSFNEYLTAGTYVLVPVWDNTAPGTVGNYTKTLQNYVLTMKTAKLNVGKQKLTITLHSGAHSMYGEAIDLYRDEVYAASIDLTVEQIKEYVELTLVNKDNQTVNLERANAGKYQIKVNVLSTDGDYSVEVVNQSATYEVEKREIKIQVDDYNHIYGDSTVRGSVSLKEGTLAEWDKDTSLASLLGLTVKAYILSDIGAEPFHVTYATAEVGEVYTFVATQDIYATDDDSLFAVSHENYTVTENARGVFNVVPREIEIKFTSAGNSSVYGEEINLYEQPESAVGDIRKNGEYIICTVTGLRVNGGRHYLSDAATLTLVKDGNELTDLTKAPAGTYEIKITANKNYKIKNGVTDNGKEGAYIQGGKYVVTPKNIALTLTANKNSITYGNTLAQESVVLGYNVVGELVEGETSNDLGITVGIFAKNGNTNVANSIATQNAGDYYVVLVECANTNYKVTSAPNLDFTINKRAVTAKPDAISHVYGNSFAASGLTYTVSNLAAGDTKESLNLAIGVYNASDVEVTGSIATQDVGTYTIKLNETAVSQNYTVTTQTADFEIVQRKITITAQDVEHYYGEALGANELKRDITTSNGTGEPIVSQADLDSLAIKLKVYDGETPVTDVAALTAGRYTIKVDYTKNANYNVTIVSAKFDVVTLNVTITFKPNAGSVYGDEVDLSQAYDIDGLLKADENAYTVTAKLNGVEASSSAPVGTYIVTVTITNPNYTVKYTDDKTTGEYKIAKRAVTISPNAVSHTYGDSYDATAPDYTVSGKGFVGNDESAMNIRAVIRNAANADVTSAIAKQNVSGSYTVALTYTTNDNYDVKVGAAATFTIAKREISLIFGSDGTSVYGQAVDLYKTVASYGGLVNDLTFKDVVELAAAKGGVAMAASNPDAGDYVVTPSIKNNNFALVNGTGTGVYKITKATLTITAKDFDITYGQALSDVGITGTTLPTAKYTATSATLSSTIIASYTASVAYSTTYTATTEVSSVNITPVVNGDNNVTVSCVSGVITVKEAEITILNVDSGHTMGEYTGEEYKLFSSMNATTVNNQTVTWYYREVGQTDWIEYKNDTRKDARETRFEVMATAKNHNAKIHEFTIDFAIAKNSITIKADNQSVIYGDDLSGITFTSKIVYADGQTKLTADKEAFYLGKLTSASYTVAYTPVTTGVGTVDIVVACIGDDNVEIIPQNGVLTVSKRTITLTFTADGGTSVYGDNDVDLYSAAVGAISNLASGHSYEDVVMLSGQLKGAGNDVTSSKAPAGEYEITATLTAAHQNNYNLDCQGNGKYVIAKKVISVTLDKASVEYTEDVVGGVINYHNGEYGAAHNAIVKFDGVISGDALNENSGYSLLYNTALSNGQAEGKAPVKVGNYEVTVTLTNENYTFADNKAAAKFAFAVTPKTFSGTDFVWNETIVKYNANIQPNKLNNFNSNIMSVISFTTTHAGEGPQDLTANGNATTANSYYFGADGILHVAALGRAKYEVTFEISSLASSNYVIDAVDGQIVATFYIVNDKVEITLETTAWQYLDIPVLPTEENPDQGNIVPVINNEKTYYGFKYYYARVTDSTKLGELLELKKSDSFKGFDLQDVQGLYTQMIDWPKQVDKETFDVGYYVVRVQYEGIIGKGESVDYVEVEKYDIVKVEKKPLKLNKTLTEVPFDGDTQWADLDFNMPCDDGTVWNIKELVTATFNGSKISAIQAKDAKTYDVIITINDTDHYTWADDMNAINGEAIITWTIAKDTADNADGKFFTVGTIANTTYGTTVSKTDPIAKKGYGNSFTWYFANKGSLTSAIEVADADWREWNASSYPKNAGEYFVKVVLSDPSVGKLNFSDKIGYCAFTINKKDLHITLSGTFEYGNIFDSDTICSYTVVSSDLIDGDTSSVISTSGSGMIYFLVDNNGNTLTDTKKLPVDTYNLTARVTTDGMVYGLTADNYNIVLVEEYGEFKVTKKTITVTIGNAESQYGCDIVNVKTDVTVTYTGGVDTTEVINGVKAALTTNAKNTSVVRDENYTIESTYENDNFVIEYTNGVYTITPRKVYVTLNNGNGTYSDSSSFNAVTIASIVGSDNEDISAFIDGKYTITVVYNGTANDGKTTYNDSTVYPTLAGNYIATAQGDSSNKNFVMEDCGNASFIVSKFVVDSSNITALDGMYDKGRPVKPLIEDTNNYNGVSASAIYSVQLPDGGCTEATDYTLTLVLTDDATANYEWKDGENTIKFEVARAGIYVRPSGEITYGEAVDLSKITFTFIFAENGKEVTEADNIMIEIDRNSIQFKFIDEINATRPAAGTYKLSFETASGFISGFKAGNYNFALEKDANDAVVYGTYTVNKKDITIVAGSSSSYYGQQTITLSDDFTLADGFELAYADEQLKTVIKTYNPYLLDENAAAAGDYDVSAKATSDNYNVTVNIGKHTIKQLQVALTLNVSDGKYIDTPATITISNLRTVGVEGYEFAPDFVENYVVISIVGINGTTYEGTTCPVNAGEYKVTVTGISNKNFALNVNESVLERTLQIAKKEIDQTEIEIEELTYNGQDQTIELEDNAVYTVSKGVYHDADTYTIRLTLANSNYAWKGTTESVVEKQFVIKKAELTLIPEGKIIYGQSFEQSKCSYKLVGFVDGDNDSVVTGTVTYMLSGGISGEALTVKEGGYDLIVAVTDSYVSGLTAKNYNIKATSGKFVVNKRPITIQPVTSSSVYTQPINVSQQFKVIHGEFMFGDTMDVINYSASVPANAILAGEYELITNVRSDNYEVTVEKAVYTINKIKVGVEIRAIGGVYDDENQRGSIEIMSAVITNLGAASTAIDDLQFVIMYSGRSNSGVQFNSASVPTLAGMYTARVVGVDNDNYEIDLTYGIHSTMLEIAKRAIDVNSIKAKSEVYTATAIVPEIIDPIYSVGKTVYSVSYNGPFVNAGEYDINLTLTDTYNYCWKDIKGDRATIKFEITKAENKLVDEAGSSLGNVQIKINGWTYGDGAFKPQANVLDGAKEDIVFEYSTSENGVYMPVVPTSVGTYWVRATMSESDNYNAFTSKAVSFTISKRSVAIPTLQKVTDGDNRNDTYTGSLLYSLINNYDERVMRLSYDGMCRINDGTATIAALDAGTYTATLSLIDPDNYVWADSSQLVDGKVVVTWTVARKVISVLSAASNKIVVNGTDITFIPEGFNSGIMEISGNVRAHEGQYSAVVTLKDTKNYAWEGTTADSIAVDFELTGTNTVFVAIISVAAGLCVGLAVMAVILTLVYRSKKRKEQEAIDQRSREDGWND